LPGGPGGGGRLPPPPPPPEGWDDGEWENEWQGDKRDWPKHLAALVFIILAGTWWFTNYKRLMGVKGYEGGLGYARGALHNTVGGWSLMNTIAQEIEGDYDSVFAGAIKTMVGTRQQPGDLWNAWFAITGHPDKVSDQWVRQAVTTPGYFTGWTNDQYGQWAQTAVDIMSGKEKVDSIPQALEEIVKGEPKHKKHHGGMKLHGMKVK
jgi:hypothetical protein